jgi:hypothetical protein
MTHRRATHPRLELRGGSSRPYHRFTSSLVRLFCQIGVGTICELDLTASLVCKSFTQDNTDELDSVLSVQTQQSELNTQLTIKLMLREQLRKK